MTSPTAPHHDTIGDLVQVTAAALGQHPRTAGLVQQLPTVPDTSPLRIALVGPYNAGKTMLVAALVDLPATEVEALAAATPKTSQVTSYAWEGRTLSDLPGTLSGLEAHDSEAWRGVRTADLLMIVTTVELPGEAETAQIRRLLDDEGFAGRSLVVVNKANTENSSAEEIQRQIQLRLGERTPPVVFTDARDYVDAAQFAGLPDDARQLLREGSGIDTLADTLRSLLDGQESDPRVEAQRFEVVRVLDAAISAWDLDADEEAETATARRLERSLQRARQDLTLAAEQEIDGLQHAVRGVGESLSAAVDAGDGSLSDTDVEAAASGEQNCVDAYVKAVNEAAAGISARLAADLGLAAKQHEAYMREHPSRHASVPTGPVATDDADQIADRARQKAQQWLRRGAEKVLDQGSRPSDPAHALAKKLNRLLGREPRPYVHINTARKLQRGVKYVNIAVDILGPAADLKGVVDDTMRRRKIDARRSTIRKAYEEQAAKLAAALREDIPDLTDVAVADFEVELQPFISFVTDRERQQRHALTELGALRERTLLGSPARAR